MNDTFKQRVVDQSADPQVVGVMLEEIQRGIFPIDNHRSWVGEEAVNVNYRPREIYSRSRINGSSESERFVEKVCQKSSRLRDGQSGWARALGSRLSKIRDSRPTLTQSG